MDWNAIKLTELTQGLVQKGKGCRAPLERRQGAHLPLWASESVGG